MLRGSINFSSVSHSILILYALSCPYKESCISPDREIVLFLFSFTIRRVGTSTVDFKAISGCPAPGPWKSLPLPSRLVAPLMVLLTFYAKELAAARFTLFVGPPLLVFSRGLPSVVLKRDHHRRRRRY